MLRMPDGSHRLRKRGALGYAQSYHLSDIGGVALPVDVQGPSCELPWVSTLTIADADKHPNGDDYNRQYAAYLYGERTLQFRSTSR